METAAVTPKLLDEREKLTSLILDIGEVLLRAGAEVNRVEDTIRRIGRAYGFVRVEIFAINNMISLSVSAEDGKVFSQIRRITSAGVDLEKVAEANELSRSVCANPVPADELEKRIREIEASTVRYSSWVRFLAYLLAATSFTVFFGGGWPEAIASAITSQVLCLSVNVCNKLKIQHIIAHILNAFVMTMTIAGVTLIGTKASFDTVIMGNIMLLIPGLSLTTSIRDLITGDTVTGLMGICDALLKAFAIAVGCVAAMLLTGMS